MAAKRPSTARKRSTARRRTTARRRHPATRVRIPRSGPLHARLSSWLVLRVIVPAVTDHNDIVRSRKDAAILRATHEGCPTCKGNGQVFTKGKNGEFTGSKPCPAQPTKTKVSRMAVWKASRFGGDKRSGLVGVSCPCGWKQKPRYRDAKEATKALRAHEKQKHGGKTVGGTWYAQVPKGAATAPPPPARSTVSKINTNLPMSDADWEKQNKPPSAAVAKKRGLCQHCTNGAQYTARGGVQRTVVCGVCQGSGKAAAAVHP